LLFPAFTFRTSAFVLCLSSSLFIAVSSFTLNSSCFRRRSSSSLSLRFSLWLSFLPGGMRRDLAELPDSFSVCVRVGGFRITELLRKSNASLDGLGISELDVPLGAGPLPVFRSCPISLFFGGVGPKDLDRPLWRGELGVVTWVKKNSNPSLNQTS